jgi:hypothetical protein
LLAFALPAVQNLPHLHGQARRAEGLLEKGPLGLQEAVPHHGVVGVPRQEQDLHPRVQPRQTLGHLAPAEAGPDDVGHQQVDPPAVPSRDPHWSPALTTSAS